MKKFILEITVFISGAMIMILELAASRIMAPHFGTSNIIWTSIIGIILFSNSIGYYIGGVIADKNPRKSVLSIIIALAGVWVLILPIFNNIILSSIESNISDIRIGAVISSIILFLAPTMLLGIVSPFSIKLKIDDVSNTGKIAGKLSAIATLGSIAGTFLAGFVLIPLIGSTAILYIIGITLVILSILIYIPNLKIIMFKSAVCIVLVLIGNLAVIDDKILDIDSQYGRIIIYNAKYQGGGLQVLEINKGFESGMFIDAPYELAFEYTKYYDLMNYFKNDINMTLLIGGAAYSYPKYYLNNYPQRSMDVIEIDKMVTKIAKEYFYLEESDRLNIFHEDGRIYLNKNTKKYDIILNDAFNGETPPFHLATKEAIEKIYESLNENGVYLTNIISSLEGQKARLLKEEVNTLKTIFPNVYVFACGNKDYEETRQNIMVVASKEKNKREIKLTEDSNINKMLLNYCEIDFEKAVVLTDEYAPIDYYVH